MDLESIFRWEDYSRAKDEMMVHTDIPSQPVVRGGVRHQEARPPEHDGPPAVDHPLHRGTCPRGRSCRSGSPRPRTTSGRRERTSPTYPTTQPRSWEIKKARIPHSKTKVETRLIGDNSFAESPRGAVSQRAFQRPTYPQTERPSPTTAVKHQPNDPSDRLVRMNDSQGRGGSVTVIRAAITQTTWTGDKESMLDKHEQFAREAAAAGRAGDLLPGAVLRPVLRHHQDAKYYDYAEPADGPIVAALRGAGRRSSAW